jgi:S-adenosyl-l-methionine hydroxide adenosyltransferase
VYPPVTVLTDCFDDNARARTSARISALFGAAPTMSALRGPAPEATASLTLLDVLGSVAHLGEQAPPTITILNIAPRDGRWPNGAPFCFFRHGPHLVISTLSLRSLALVSRYLGVRAVQTTDVRTVLDAAAANWATLTTHEIDLITTSQFRSLWYVPLLTKWLADGRDVPAATTPLAQTDDDAAEVCVVDNFGNCKLNRTPEELGAGPGSSVKVRDHRIDSFIEVPFLNRLSDVPAGETALIVGSSAFGLAELVVAGGSAAARLGLHEGFPVFP